MNKILLRRTARVLAGHSWIFSNELASSLKSYDPGSLVEVFDMRDNFMGIGYVNPNSLIAVRLLTRKKESIGAEFFRKRLLDALQYRSRIGIAGDSFRAAFSEGDLLPGLIADKYGDCVVLQFLTLGMEKMKDLIIPAIDDVLAPASIVLRNDSRSRSLEGLPLVKEVIKGSLSPLPVIREGNISFEIDPLGGQKTGFFLDQRENRLAMAGLVRDGRGLDLFCYAGAWGLQLAANGAEVTFVDDSEAALSQVMSNAARNRLSDKCSCEKSDVFSFLKDRIREERRYDFIVLDPPAFVKSRLKVKEALKGYREINTLAMQLLREGGVLATSSCSYHIEKQAFVDMLRDSAREARKQFKLIELRAQGKDHPILLSVPETEYLKCAFLSLTS
ncbi:MAG TPA: class I SAM-dependent rRNA methyltransferase [Dissulfurispiraceae bacterium]|nr:class I SAM-dependent rRNA methyltransferase [Dissulfurispiraceae bacterium]